VQLRGHVADDHAVHLGHQPDVVLGSRPCQQLLDPLRQSAVVWDLEPLRVERGVVAATIEPAPREVGAIARARRPNGHIHVVKSTAAALARIPLARLVAIGRKRQRGDHRRLLLFRP
jgi:hypothetical protein